jgi:hypothetical protein
MVVFFDDSLEFLRLVLLKPDIFLEDEIIPF